MYGTHQAAPLTVGHSSSTSQACAPPCGDQYTTPTSRDVKQEVKEEETEMNWLEVPGTGEQSYVHAPQASTQIGNLSDRGDASRPNEAELSPFVKVEQSYPAHYDPEVSDGGIYSPTQAMLYAYGSPNVAAYAFAQEYGPDSQAGDWMVSLFSLKGDIGLHLISLLHTSPKTARTYPCSRGSTRLRSPMTTLFLTAIQTIGPRLYLIIVPTPWRTRSLQSHRSRGQHARLTC